MFDNDGRPPINDVFPVVKGEFEYKVKNALTSVGAANHELPGLGQALKALDLTFSKDDASRSERSEMASFAAMRLLEEEKRNSPERMTRPVMADKIVHEVSQRMSAKTLMVVAEIRDRSSDDSWKQLSHADAEKIRTANGGLPLNPAQLNLSDQIQHDPKIRMDFENIAKGDFHMLSKDMAIDLNVAMKGPLKGRLSESMILADKEFARKEVLRSSLLQNAAQGHSVGL